MAMLLAFTHPNTTTRVICSACSDENAAIEKSEFGIEENVDSNKIKLFYAESFFECRVLETGVGL